MISNESIENNFKQNINPYNADNISIIKNPESETNIKDTPDNISIIKNTESEIDIKNTCIILYGRQNKKAKKNIMKIIEFLNAALLLVLNFISLPVSSEKRWLFFFPSWVLSPFSSMNLANKWCFASRFSFSLLELRAMFLKHIITRFFNFLTDCDCLL